MKAARKVLTRPMPGHSRQPGPGRDLL